MPQVTVSGPLFTLGARVIHEAIRDTIQDLLERGEQKVKAQLYPGHGLLTGHYRRSVVGEMTDSRHGRLHDSNVVYGPWLEGVSRRNMQSRFKGYAMFRRAAQEMQRISGARLQHHIGRALRRVA